ncbi:MAG: hypothetical protein HY282_10285 [Nitrospirae bacterium]|nr:hypothetical protein [Candidatus Manganitrophaceae bacterium]
MKRLQLVFLSVSTLIFTTTSALFAAPIGVPGATVGANKSDISAEANFLFDRDITGNAGGGTAEGTQAFAKGTVGLTDRVDLVVRLGFGDFKVKDQSPSTLNIDSGVGPAFGLGLKATWAQMPDANLKIGTVLQTTHLRSKDGDSRFGWTEYDAAIGAFLDSGSRSLRAGDAALIPYGGVVWSGLDINGAALEDKTFGIFVGVLARFAGNLHVGIELRVPDQTALGVEAGFSF